MNALLFSNASVPHSGAAAQAIEAVLAAGRNIAHQHPTDAPEFFAAEKLIHQAFINAEKWRAMGDHKPALLAYLEAEYRERWAAQS